MDFPHGETVTVLSTTTTRDDYGNETTTVTQVAWGPVALAPRTATEGTDPHAPAVIVGLTIYGPPTFADGSALVIDADDQILIGETLYDVDGEAGDWRSPFTGWHPGVEVALVRAAS